MDQPTMRKKLVEIVVAKLRAQFGLNVNESNILTDPIYSAIFKRMLENSRGKGWGEDVIDALLSEIERNNAHNEDDLIVVM